MSAKLEIVGSVAVVTLDSPPVNALNLSTRREIVEHVDRANRIDFVQSILLIGSGRMFSGGADIHEFATGKADAAPHLTEVIRVVEASPKPVIAALHGAALGGGLELALGAHYRIAVPGVQLGLPEVNIGLIPGAGGTQRLPRAIGLESALEMTLTGRSITSETAFGKSEQLLLNSMIEGDLLPRALEYCAQVAPIRPLPKLRDMVVSHPNPEGYLDLVRQTVASASGHEPAKGKCIDAAAAACSPEFERGMQLEGELFASLMGSAQARARRHAFLAQRASNKLQDVPEGLPGRDIKAAAIIGAGTMGCGIAINFLNAGVPVTMLEMTQDALDRGRSSVRATYEKQVSKGALDPERLENRMSLLSTTLSYGAIRDCDIVIEAVFEEMGVKDRVFLALDEVMKPGAILASNTSTLDIDKIAAMTKRPHDVLGLHFFSPANVMKLLEIVRGRQTSPDVLATALKLAKKIKKTAVVSGVCDGFIGNRMVEQYLRQAGLLLEEGCSPQQVDRAVEEFGMAMGPFRMSDLAGNDIGWAIRKRRYQEQPNMRYSGIFDRICELGRLGQKTGAGWYDYAPGKRDARASQTVTDVIESFRLERGCQVRTVSDQEIVQRLVFALVNEGAKILEEGIAQKSSDIDVVYLSGYGFPVWRGGPMCYANEVGLWNVARAMRQFQQNPAADPEFWQPASGLATLANEGRHFS
jgi:3-hydroxyacyl-CoA dehydrogenase